jgi:hypothetical protein
MTTITSLQAQIDRLQSQIEQLSRFGDDVYDPGAVLVFDKTFTRSNLAGYKVDGTTKPYNYAVIKAGDGYWYLTGKQSMGKTWSELVEFLSEGVDEVYLCTTAEPI